MCQFDFHGSLENIFPVLPDKSYSALAIGRLDDHVIWQAIDEAAPAPRSSLPRLVSLIQRVALPCNPSLLDLVIQKITDIPELLALFYSFFDDRSIVYGSQPSM